MEDGEVIKVIQKLAKQRKDSIEQYTAGGGGGGVRDGGRASRAGLGRRAGMQAPALLTRQWWRLCRRTRRPGGQGAGGAHAAGVVPARQRAGGGAGAAGEQPGARRSSRMMD